jgi:hypothetical protein
MPCDPEKRALLDAAMDVFLEARRLYPDDDDEDECDPLNPLDAPPGLLTDGEHGGPPEKIHNED